MGVRRIPPGDIVYEAGKPVAHFLVITAGHVEAVQPTAAGSDLPIVVHGPGAFTGEVNMLSGRPSLRSLPRLGFLIG